MPLLDYEFKVAESKDDPVQFAISVRGLDDEVLRKETFTVRDVLPLTAFANVAVVVGGGWIASRAACFHFFQRSLIGGDLDRWNRLCDDEKLKIRVEDLAKIMEDVVEATSDRPTSAPSD